SSEQIRARNVFDEREVARLLAVFVQHRRQIIQQACAKNCYHAGIWIEDRLPRSVRAGVTQRDRGNADLLSPEQHEALLINFRQPVTLFSTDRPVLRRRNALCYHAANRTVNLPIAATQLFNRPHVWEDQSMLWTFARAFAVNGLRAGNDDLFDREIVL